MKAAPTPTTDAGAGAARGRIEPAELLYGRLLASVAGGVEPGGARIRIGGAPEALLARARALVAPGGAVLVETGPPDAPTRRVRVRLETPGAVSPWFGWATVGARGIAPLGRAAGLRPAGTFSAGGRWFARLERLR